MSSDGYLVRWQLISVREVYALPDEVIDPHGTEVYSKLRTARMQPEYRWHPEKKARMVRVFEVMAARMASVLSGNRSGACKGPH
jgi:hypothetical protein